MENLKKENHLEYKSCKKCYLDTWNIHSVTDISIA